jgi:hypothetical protein
MKKTIDIYVKYLISDKSNDLSEEHFKNKKYSQKILDLVEFESSLMKKAEIEKLPILRMKGVVQSYEIYDSI